jgi:hypothetical protein
MTAFLGIIVGILLIATIAYIAYNLFCDIFDV